jgi:hypothetical protein
MNLLQIDHVPVPVASTPLSSLISIQPGLQELALFANGPIKHELGKPTGINSQGIPAAGFGIPITAATAGQFEFSSYEYDVGCETIPQGILTVQQYG